MNMKTVGYDNLKMVQSIIPPEYDSIVEQLIYQYDDVLKILDRTHDFLLEDVRANHDYLFKNYEWFSDPGPDHLNKDRIQYFIHDLRYKGMVSNYIDASTDEYVRWATIYLETAMVN